MWGEVIQWTKDYGSAFTGGAIVISALAGSGLWISQRDIAKKRAMIDHITRSQSDIDFQEHRARFNKLRKANSITKAVLAGEEVDESAEDFEETEPFKDRQAVLEVLNDYELIACGIKERIYSERLYMRWFKTTVTRDWDACKTAIGSLRDGNGGVKSHFVEFEKLAEKWKNCADPNVPKLKSIYWWICGAWWRNVLAVVAIVAMSIWVYEHYIR
ncbi:DUF4760 domain-containing protein [Emcibacter sp.]|uniref:DUF4760 domain-containing protein n=1 Tax=Emcibacter sp. TaxID=1979954 RepID=UPI003A8F0E07